MKYIHITCLLLLAAGAKAQQGSLTLDECQTRAKENYPLIRQHELIRRTKEYSIANAGKAWLPQISFSGQASYQSETIAWPFKVPGVTLPTFSKDQYRMQAEVDQTIYDAGATKYQKEGHAVEANIQDQQSEVDLYALRDRVDQLFFGILLLDEQLKLNDLQKSDLQNGVAKTQAALNNGTAFRSSLDELKAEVLHSDQERADMLSSRKAFADMLSLFIHAPVGETTLLVSPPAVTVSSEIKRPELALFDYRRTAFDVQEKQLRMAYLPRVSAYVQGAYGRPTLNFISNDFGFWAIGGIRFSWSLSGMYTNRNDRRILDLDRKDLDIQKETWLFNTRLALTQQNEIVNKFRALLEQDQEIIDLRESVKKSALAQLENGVSTSHDYIGRVNAENEARQSQILHQIQLLQAEYGSLNTSGN